MKNEISVLPLTLPITMITSVNEFTYDLPHDRIALHPLTDRDDSKLLIYRRGEIKHRKFTNLPAELPDNSMLVFNNTKVIPARLRFKKDTGAAIEVFLLEPTLPSTLLSHAMQTKGECTWKCAIGNLKRWNSESTLSLSINNIELDASLIERTNGIVRFQWRDHLTFAEVIESLGNVPLPPYIKRTADEHDKQRYQTVYSEPEGAVAAPTAGLHFTSRTLQALKEKAIPVDFVTLHVSAGTFLPIKVEDITDHQMHREQIIITLQNIKNLLRGIKVIAVGTTSMRTLESLFWFGVKLLENSDAKFSVNQNDPYQNRQLIPKTTEALYAVIEFMEMKKIDQIIGETSIFIRPGYIFRICQGLITNFHQPASTLILLVAAFIGDDWKRVYAEAMNNGYRFLSYGDSSLLLPDG
ncbi:MAG: S-adenosylmethionine:tRNA ribosyltransferase-isomerase [Chryseolinea sp.]